MRPLSRRVRRLLALAVLSGATALGGCTSDCGFKPHCEGNTVMECRYGVDQFVGAGQPVVYACAAAAPVCVEARTQDSSEGDSLAVFDDDSRAYGSEDTFLCAREPLTECDASFVSACEGATLHVLCRRGYVTVEDCTNGSGSGRCGAYASGQPVRCL